MDKKIKLLFIAGILLITGIAKAQSADSLAVDSERAKIEAIASRLERELSLTEDQTQKLTLLLEERFSGIRQAGKSNESQRNTVELQSRKKLASILTSEQLALYRELREETQRQKDEFLKENSNFRFSETDKELDF